MSIKQRIKKFFNDFETALFSNHGCICCRREIRDLSKYSLCEDCNKNLERINGNICKKCGSKINLDNQFCDDCKAMQYDFDRSLSFSEYGEFASKIIKRFKYGSKVYYAKHIAEMMFENKEVFQNLDYITFVPIGEKRRRERGFNQAEQMALELSKLANIPVLSLFSKMGNENHQAGLTRIERLKNLKGTIVVNQEQAKQVKNKKVLIIDDVFTTGSTLSECARVLKASKASKPSFVACYTFAKTNLNSTNNQ